MRVLVSGGAGFIGSHTVVELLASGHEVVIVDNFSNSNPKVLDRLEMITGRRPVFYEADVRDQEALNRIFDREGIEAVIQFAGLKAVGESCTIPLDYYDNNIGGTLAMLKAMQAHGVKNFVFSSSATVYGSPKENPIREDAEKQNCTNPYGWTKWMQEQILTDIVTADPSWNVILLRYFNPIGAHESGLIGEDPKGIPNNLLPYITQVAVGKRDYLRVNGNDYATHDGTGVRDYIHVVDLARGHVAAIQKLAEGCGLKIYNLGTGNGYSVLDVVHAFEKAVGKEIPYKIVERRPGDIDTSFADPSLAEKELHWKATFAIDKMCKDAWNWQKNNPNGYEG